MFLFPIFFRGEEGGGGGEGWDIDDLDLGDMSTSGGEISLYTLHPTPHTLHPTPYTQHPTPHTLHPTLYILHPTDALS